MKKIIKWSTVAAFSLSLLAGCNPQFTDDARDNLQTRNTTYRDVAYDQRNVTRDQRNVTRDQRNITRDQRNIAIDDRNLRDADRIRNIGTQEAGQTNQGGDVLEINNGFITIDPNSFSTTIPSEKFPHSVKIEERGPYAIYKFQKEIPLGERQPGQPGQPGGQQAAPPETRQAPDTQQAQEQKADQPESTEDISETEMKVIELTNAERRKNGLSDLKADASLSNVARDKSKDMQTNNYFSHQSPTHGSPFDMMRDYGVSYNTAGENIAMGQRSPEEVVQAWMNSEGHRKNILNGNFTHIGVGYVEQGNYWTQMFIGK